MRKLKEDGYIMRLRNRKKKSGAGTSHQLTGLVLAEVLADKGRKSKAIYIKLAKEYDNSALMALAKDVASRDGVRNKGAYFMRVFQKERVKMRRVWPKSAVVKKRNMRLKLKYKTRIKN